MKIVFLDESTVTLGDIDFAPLQAAGDYVGYDNSSAEEVVARAAAADVVIANKAPITGRVLAAAGRLKLVSVIATGYNNVDMAAAGERGVTVCNVAGYARHTVPQHTFALILNLATQVYRYHAEVRAGAWQRAEMFTLLTQRTFELAGKTLGVVGYGTIGRRVGAIGKAFGMRILGCDQGPLEAADCTPAALDTLLAESDVVTLHCPLTDQTRGLIGPRQLARMKPTALLINTARGGIVDEAACAAALNQGRLAGAGFDCLTVEPPRSGNPLLTARNIIITPHSAWSTVEARQSLVNETAANITAFCAGRPRNVVS